MFSAFIGREHWKFNVMKTKSSGLVATIEGSKLLFTIFLRRSLLTDNIECCC